MRRHRKVYRKLQKQNRNVVMDERLKLIDDVIALNNRKIAIINKKASESRKPMSKEDKKKTSKLYFINRELGKMKYEIVQTLVIGNDTPIIEILGLPKLNEDIDYYKSMFPKTYMTLENIVNALIEEYKRIGIGGGTFGFSVSPEWEDKCYAFEPIGENCGKVYYKYVGIYKS